MNDIRLYASHLPILIKLVEMTDGPILEFGAGVSTWVLDMLCQPTKRKLVTLESDWKWFQEYLKYTSDYHLVLHIADWDIDWEKYDFNGHHWSVALIDHRPALRRKTDAYKLKDHANFILLHDSEPEINRFYRYDRIYKFFRYRYDYTKIKPYTTVLSNFFDLKNL